MQLLANENFPVILFRIAAPSPEAVARVAVQALTSHSDWAGHFAVVEDDHIRLTPLPKPA